MVFPLLVLLSGVLLLLYFLTSMMGLKGFDFRETVIVSGSRNVRVYRLVFPHVSRWGHMSRVERVTQVTGQAAAINVWMI